MVVSFMTVVCQNLFDIGLLIEVRRCRIFGLCFITRILKEEDKEEFINNMFIKLIQPVWINSLGHTDEASTIAMI